MLLFNDKPEKGYAKLNPQPMLDRNKETVGWEVDIPEGLVCSVCKSKIEKELIYCDSEKAVFCSKRCEKARSMACSASLKIETAKLMREHGGEALHVHLTCVVKQ